MTPNVHFLQLPSRIKGYARQNPDGTYTIILNSRLSFEQNIKTYFHEMKHIKNNDFDKLTVEEAEGWE